MPRPLKINSVNRIIDANFNRLKEGLRVCEEITRFILDDKKLTAELKGARHKADSLIRRLDRAELLEDRDTAGDIGKRICAGELKRSGVSGIFFANMQRVKESIRVLEEFLKLKDARLALGFKKLRYGIYEIEKKSFKKIAAISYPR